MKKTIRRPLVIGVLLGFLAGIATATGLSFITPGINIENAIGVWMTLILLSAALGGPLAGTIASTLFMIIATLLGPPDMKEILSDPINFWSNLIVVGIIMIMVGFVYRSIFEHSKMPARLLFWAGIVIAVYIIISPITISFQFYLHGEVGVLPAIMSSYKIFLPQAIFDIIITSLVFVALPARYARPLWYEF
jgi:hypothetical protein